MLAEPEQPCSTVKMQDLPTFVVALRTRSKQFALEVLRIADTLPRRTSTDAIARQLVRSSMSVAANYRAAQRGRSKAEFVAKLGIVIEEADETLFWLEMLQETGAVPPARIAPLARECTELLKIFVASRKTAKC